MFQIAFPKGHAWDGLSLAVFHCTSCADENYLIPEMLNATLKGVDIPRDFLTEYQRNFRTVVFRTRTGSLHKDYVEKVRFRPLSLIPIPERERPISEPVTFSDSKEPRVGGNAEWILDDETPGTYDREVGMCFLMQLPMNFAFPLVEGAPPQTEWEPFGGGTIDSPLGHYVLFLGNAIYFYGTSPDVAEPLVYFITQVQ